ncbi:Predicted metal-dependent hydrolase, TIM-barrel fold [Planctomicrobium piriforme]|uniref:Predicted metal-dependent hydrolase, TIM-barrel fold n=2 Tax=Planctomicrobium piriforme TaxID=1576369 RepID=A0A1I3GP45_9PLAN|nr:Predicted metal-dependent hydrolase, TIM-barrel fold [Planctomicrobium piriforme]
MLVFLSLASSSLTCAVAEEPATAEKPQRLYLDEFRPTASLKGDEHLLTRAKFPCVNVHSHPGKLTPRELDEMVRVMDESNIAVSVSLDGGFNGAKFIDHFYTLTQLHPNRFVVFQRIDYVGDGLRDDPKTWDVHRPGYGVRMADKLTEAVKQGACGMKVWKDLGLYMKDLDGNLIAVDDPRFDPVWARAGELGIPILWHCGDPPAFFQPTNEKNERWEELYRHPEWSFHGEGFPTHAELMAARNRVIARHPETTFICAHMGELAEDLGTLGKLLDKYPNMNVEIAARVSELGRQPYSARKFFMKYPDRILFGTDGVPPMSELVPHFRFLETWDEYFAYEDNPFPPQGLWNIYGLGLPDDVLRKVYNENASRLIPTVGEKVRKYELQHSRQAKNEP